jgi:hypothetical protein
MPKTCVFTARHCRPAVVAVGFILTAALALGSFSGSARAQWHDGDRRGHHHGYWDRGYYEAPPVVYGRPYYAPPVVYGFPPGLNIIIR